MRRSLVPILFAKPGWVLPGATLDMDFANNRAWRKGNGLSLPASLLTTTRASTGYAANSSGLLVPFLSNIPRITDLGLLVEQAATNLALQSAFGGATGTPWSLFSTTITTNAATAPDNTVTAALIKEDSSVAFHRIGTTTNIATAASTAYTLSLYAKTGPGSKRWLWINPNFSGGGSVSVTVDLTDGTTSGASGSPTVVTQVRGGFVFIAVTFTTSVGTTSTDLRIGLNNAVGAAASYTGDGTSGNYVSSAQLELGSFATSYIPTTTVSVTRAADAISLAVNNSRLTIGSLYTKVLWPTFNGTANIFVEGNNGASLVGATLAMTTATNYEVDARNGATAGGRGSSSGNAGLAAGASARLGVSWDSATTPNGSFNGAASSAFGAQSEADWAGNSLSIGSRGAGNSLFANTYIQRVTVWYGQKLSTAQLAALP